MIPARRHPLARLRAELWDSVSMAMQALAAHKLRSFLTLLGVMVGVFSIIVVMTAIRVMQTSIERELGQLGAHTFSVDKFPPIFVEGPDGWERVARRRNITWAQVRALQDRATLPLLVAAETQLRWDQVTSRYAQFETDVPLYGITPEAFSARNWVIEQGRAILASDVDGARQVCVLGSSVARTLFPHSTPVGETIKFAGINYTVAGVLEARGATLGGDQDAFVLTPLSTGLNRYGAPWRSLSILVQSRSPELLDDTMEQVRGILRALRKVRPTDEDDFEVFTNDSLIAQFRSITFAVRAGAAVISSIALLAAGIGIMNIMLVSVTERTREIGVRRAVGAKKRNILAQFLTEAVAICQVGGAIGAVLGIAAGNIAAVSFKVPPVLPVDWVVLSLLICSGVGLVFGTYPAVKAANMDPVESLRYE
jgi:putative ABC transport system permease protein